jgi:hypothetical protein
VAKGNIDWLSEGRKGTGRSEMKCEREVAIAMTEEFKPLTIQNRKICRKSTEYR